MFTLKHVVVFFIMQNTVSSFCFFKDRCHDQDYPESTTPTSDKLSGYYDFEDESPENNFIQFPEDEDSENSSNEDSENNSNENPENNNNVNPDNDNNEKPDNNSNEIPENDKNEHPKKKLTDNCPEDHSKISHSDINYLIEQNAEILKIKQHFVKSSYPNVAELIEKYETELENFLETFIDRPEHMQHILYDIAGLRQKLEPEVENIVSQLEQFHSLENAMNVAVQGSDNKLNQFRKYKNFCQMNCDEIDIRNRFGQNNNDDPSLVLKSAGMYCIRLEDLNNIIDEKLSEVQAQHNDSLYVQLEVSDKMYAQKLTEFKTNLKKSAVSLFGMTMYDILSLQDDYHHFAEHLENVNISPEIHNIRKNTAEIGFRLIELERDLEQYREHCLKCVINQRIKRNVFDLLDESTLNDVQERFDVPMDEKADVETAVIELIKVKIDEIRESINSNMTAMFDELDRKLNDSEVIDEYVMRLRPIQDTIENNVKKELDALLELKSLIPEESIDKIVELSKKSKQTVDDLESAKQFIDQFIS